MGLCKCPKRKVTNLFCFEHRVNVCEHCLVLNHESCVVQTYLSWLTDSDYDSNCVLCSEPLSSKETIRLKCFHVFHWACFNMRASQLPNTTAPAGYKCPSCLDVIFPSINQTSPVIDHLREKLSKVQWATNGLDLDGYSVNDRSSPAVNLSISHDASPKPRVSYSAVNIEGQTVVDPFETNTFTARSKMGNDSSPNDESNNSTVRFLDSEDSADTKYSRRNADRNNRRFNFSRPPRTLMRILVLIIVIFIVYYALFNHSTNSPEDDAKFDPHANPNIRIESS